MATQQDRAQLDAKAKEGQTVVPGGTGGKSLESQEHLAEGVVFNFHGCLPGFSLSLSLSLSLSIYIYIYIYIYTYIYIYPVLIKEKCVVFWFCFEGRSRGGQKRRQQLGTEGYQEMGRKGGLSTGDHTGGERAAEEGVSIDESK